MNSPRDDGFKFVSPGLAGVRKYLPALVVALIAGVVGFASLRATRAATFAANAEAESGTVSGNQTTGDTVGASGGASVKFGAAGSPGLPAGVSLQDIDGGQGYFEQWSNSMPSARQNPGFFPITLFNEFDLASKASAYKNIGINFFTGLYNGALDGSPNELSVAQTNGMQAIFEPIYPLSQISPYGKTAAGYVYQDEAENNDCTTIDIVWLRAYCTESGGKVATSSFITMTNQMHQLDATRPVYNGFTNGYVFDWFLNGTAADLAKGSDIVGYDVYPLVDRRSDFDGALAVGKVWGMYQTVALARQHANNTRPIWPDVETSQVDTFNIICYRPTGADVQALVWNAIVAGARGITYFNNNFASNCNTGNALGSDVLLNSTYADIKTAVAAVNGRIKNLAPVINSMFANGYETHTGQVNTMVKYYNNQFYIFASPKADGSQTATFTLAGAGNGTVTVVDENRSLTLSGGKFTDTFANPDDIHIYKIN